MQAAKSNHPWSSKLLGGITRACASHAAEAGNEGTVDDVELDANAEVDDEHESAGVAAKPWDTGCSGATEHRNLGRPAGSGRLLPTMRATNAEQRTTST